MKKFLALLFSFSLLFCANGMNALACEQSEGIECEKSGKEITTREVVELLRYDTVGGEGVVTIGNITPKAGSNLRVIAISPKFQILMLYQNGRKVASIGIGPCTSSQEYSLYRNCNGNSYEVRLAQAGIYNPTLIGVFQTDYLK